MKTKLYHGWRWRRFGLAIGVDIDWGLDFWLELGFYYVGIEMWRK